MERRASLVFKLLAAFVAFVLIVTGANTPDSDFPLLRWATIGYALAIIAVDLIEAIGLDRGLRWAVAAMRPMLWVQLVAGIIGTIDRLTHGTVPIPFDLILLVWALRGTASVRPAPSVNIRAAALIVTSAIVALNGAWLEPIFGAGGLLGAAQHDLQAEITVQCGPAGTGSPETVLVTYRWSWARSGPPTGGSDVVVIAWDGSDEAGGQLYILGDTPATAEGIQAGTVTGVATTDADFFAQSHGGSWEWGIDLGLQRYAPGEITVVLHRAADHPSTGTQLTVEGVYAHSGAWRSHPSLTSCEW
jgi:hypothetical protein